MSNSRYPIDTNFNHLSFLIESGFRDPLSLKPTELTKRIQQLQKRVQAMQESLRVSRRARRNRRKNQDIARTQKCNYCLKIYGSKTALNFHVRSKHTPEKENCDRMN